MEKKIRHQALRDSQVMENNKVPYSSIFFSLVVLVPIFLEIKNWFENRAFNIQTHTNFRKIMHIIYII